MTDTTDVSNVRQLFPSVKKPLLHNYFLLPNLKMDQKCNVHEQMPSELAHAMTNRKKSMIKTTLTHIYIHVKNA